MSKKYFINNLDTAFGQALLQELVKEPTQQPVHMCTVRVPADSKPNGIKKILKREKPKLFRKKAIQECEVYIYNINQTDISDIDFGIQTMAKPFQDNKVFILVSDIMAWSACQRKVKKPQTKPPGEQNNEEEPKKQQEDGEPKSQNDGDASESGSQKQKTEEQKPIQYTFYEDTDFEDRVPLEKYSYIKEIEDKVLAIKKQNIKVFVVCPGIIYGCGEDSFYPLFKAAWLQNPSSLPYLGNGQNAVSTIHLKDLVKFVIKVAENPPEGTPYLLALDETDDKKHKSIIEVISQGIGSGCINGVESSDLFEIPQIFKTDIDIRPSKFLVGTAEEPAQFEWVSRKGLKQNIKQVLSQFCEKHMLRPLKILCFQTQEQWRSQSKISYIHKTFSDYYRIPVLTIKQILDEAREKGPTELTNHLAEQWGNLTHYLQQKQAKSLDETMKVFYRAVRWRLSQNDCLNRGYILDNFPAFSQELQYIFMKISQKKLKRKQKKKPKEEKPKEDGEGGEGEGQAKQEQQQKEQQPEQEQQQEGEGPKVQSSYPESLISVKRMGTLSAEVIDFFTNREMQELIYDTTGAKEHQIFESLRSYIERNGRPNNYLISEEELMEKHKKFTEGENEHKLHERKVQQEKRESEKKSIEDKRKKLAQEISEIVSTEGEQEIKKMPFRNYLMQFVVPTLNEGLLEVSNIIPNDPVDLLAEYLYQKSYDF